MYHLIKIDTNENGETVTKGLSAKTEKDLLNKALKQNLITEEEKTAYKHGTPCITIIKGDSYEKALNEFIAKFNNVYSNYAHVELK